MVSGKPFTDREKQAIEIFKGILSHQELADILTDFFPEDNGGKRGKRAVQRYLQSLDYTTDKAQIQQRYKDMEIKLAAQITILERTTGTVLSNISINRAENKVLTSIFCGYKPFSKAKINNNSKQKHQQHEAESGYKYT